MIRNTRGDLGHDLKICSGNAEMKAPSQNIERGQANRDNWKEKFERKSDVSGEWARTPEKLAAHTPARFKTEHNCRYADSDPAEKRDNVQSFTGSRKKFNPAEIDRSEQSRESDSAEIGFHAVR